MDRLQAMEVFIRVVDTNSFTKAAHTLNLPRASVTNIIQNLEAYLKVRLLQRTTRRLNLTADGASYYDRCVRVLAEIDEIESAFSATKIVPRGRLRIETSGPVGKLVLIPALDDFHARYPDIELTIGMSDRRVDIIEDGVDCAIRVGSLVDSNMVGRRLSDFHFLTAATPGYLQRHGVPASLQELDGHVAAKYISARTSRPMELRFLVDGKEVEVKLPATFTVNDAEAHLAMGLKGLPVPDRAHAGAALFAIGRAGGSAAAVEAGEDGNLAGLSAGPPPVAGAARLHPVDHRPVRGPSFAGRPHGISAAHANSFCHFSCCMSARGTLTMATSNC